MTKPEAKLKKLTVVIPCHNEAASIGQVISKFPIAKLRQAGLKLQVCVVDNCSSDNTSQVAGQAGAIVITEPRKGKGNALLAGFDAVSKDTDYVAMLDGDDTYSPQEILRLVEPLQSDFCDVVVGSRLSGRMQTTSMTAFNRLGNWLFTNGVRVGYRANVTDVLTGYFAWKKSALDDLRPHLSCQNFAIEMEMITKMARLGLQLNSVPISYHPRVGESNLCPLKDGYRIMTMYLRNLTWHRPTRIASPTSAKKIVLVSDAIYPYMKGGKEKRLFELSKRLVAQGHDVHIYTMKWWDTPERQRQENGIQLHALCRYYPLYHGSRRSIKEALLFSLACLRLIRVRFDVLDVDHMPFFPIFSCWLVCSLRRRKFYGTWHEALSRGEWTSYMGAMGHVAAAIERLSIRLPHRIIAASAHTQELLGSLHGRTERVQLVASGIDSQLMQAIVPAQVKCDVLYVGRLMKDKNLDKLITAVGLIKRHNSGMQCIIIGNGTEKARLRQQVRQLGLEHQVTFMEPLAEASEVYAYMKAAKVFCSPSTREGFGIASLEALGCGTPVITTTAPGNAARHLIIDGQNGSIVAPEAEAIASAISYWAELPAKPDINTAQEHDWQVLAQKQLEAYAL